MESIIKTGRYCFFCGRTDRLEKHHALHGTANRRKADAAPTECTASMATTGTWR